MVREAVEGNKRRFAAGNAAEAASVYADDAALLPPDVQARIAAGELTREGQPTHGLSSIFTPEDDTASTCAKPARSRR
jgi:hypothetical protein